MPYSCCNLTTLFATPRLDVVEKYCGENAISKNNIELSKCVGLFENILILDKSLVRKEFGIDLNEQELHQPDNICKYATNKTAKIKDEYKDLVYQKVY